MNSGDPWSGFDTRAGLLVDTNLLVLFVVGMVNLTRIKDFKRTSQYTADDFQLLRRVMGWFDLRYTVAHVMAEVSNLTDLKGSELPKARHVLKATIEILREPAMPSIRAARHQTYGALGLVDAAIVEVAHEHKCAVLTDDFELYRVLEREGLPVINFNYRRAGR
jgi:rRNA-processing protein FCF1